MTHDMRWGVWNIEKREIREEITASQEERGVASTHRVVLSIMLRMPVRLGMKTVIQQQSSLYFFTSFEANFEYDM